MDKRVPMQHTVSLLIDLLNLCPELQYHAFLSRISNPSPTFFVTSHPNIAIKKAESAAKGLLQQEEIVTVCHRKQTLLL